MADDVFDDMTDDELAEVLADFDDDELDELEQLAEEPDTEPEAVRAYIGFDRLVRQLQAKGHSGDSARRIAAAIGRRKYGKKFDQLRKMSRKARMRLEKTLRSNIIGGPDYYNRVWSLDDIEILRGGKGGDGRTVAAYAAVFGQRAEIQDAYGHYYELIHRSAFNRAISHGDIEKRVTVLYNHGFDLSGNPSGLGSVPIGSPVEIRADNRGLYTVTRYNRSELADAVLAAIENGDIRGYSFRGRVFKSDPPRVPRIQRGGVLPTITRMELGLSEYGPTPIPFYSEASIVAIRSQAIAEARRLPERERIIIARALLADDPIDDDTGVDENEDVTPERDDSAVEPDEGTTESSTTPDDESDVDDESTEDIEVEDPEDESPTDSDESPGTEGPPEEAPLPVKDAARSMAADIRRRARIALILRSASPERGK